MLEEKRNQLLHQTGDQAESETDLENLMSSSKLSDPPSDEPKALVPYMDTDELPGDLQIDLDAQASGETTQDTVKTPRKSRWDQSTREEMGQNMTSTPDRQGLKRQREPSAENFPSGQWQQTSSELYRESVVEYKMGDSGRSQGGPGDGFRASEQWDTGWEADEKWDEGMSEDLSSVVTDNQNQMEEKLTELLNKRLGRKASAVDIARHLGFPSKKGVNPLLYSLQKRGLLKKVQESPPIWQLVKGNQPGGPVSHIGVPVGRGLGPPGHPPMMPPGGRGRGQQPVSSGPLPLSPAELLRREGHVPGRGLHMSKPPGHSPPSLMSRTEKPDLKRPRIFESQGGPGASGSSVDDASSSVPSLLNIRPSEVRPLDTGLPPDGQLSAPYVDIPSPVPNQPSIQTVTPNQPAMVGSMPIQPPVPNQAMISNHSNKSQTSSKQGKGRGDSVQSLLKKLNSQRRGAAGGNQGPGSAQQSMASQGFTPPPSPMDILRGVTPKPASTSVPAHSAPNRLGGASHSTSQNTVPSRMPGSQPPNRPAFSAGQPRLTGPGPGQFGVAVQPRLTGAGPPRTPPLSSPTGTGPPRAPILSNGPPPTPAQMLQSSATHGVHNQPVSSNINPSASFLQSHGGANNQSSVPMDQSNQPNNKPVISTTKSPISWVSTPTAPSWAKPKTKDNSSPSQQSASQAPLPPAPTPVSKQTTMKKSKVPGIIVKPPQKMQSVNSILKQLNASRKGAYAPGKADPNRSQQQISPGFQPPPSPMALLGKQTPTPRHPAVTGPRQVTLPGGPRHALLGGLSQTGGQVRPMGASGAGMLSSMQAPRPLLNNQTQPKAPGESI